MGSKYMLNEGDSIAKVFLPERCPVG